MPLTFTPAHKLSSSREVYQVQHAAQTLMLYMIDRNVRSHTICWPGEINLDDFIAWDDKLAKLTRPGSEKKVEGKNHPCIGDFHISTRGEYEEYHIEFGNHSHDHVRQAFPRSQLVFASIDHVPFYICAIKEQGEQKPSISVGMHAFTLFPDEITTLYNTTCLTGELSRRDSQYIIRETSLRTQ